MGNDETHFTFHDPGGNPFGTVIPMFGMTETQKAIFPWLRGKNTPPVIFISHEEPRVPDRAGFRDPHELQRHYYPYAMATAKAQCFGEPGLRILKVYFCNTELHEAARYGFPATHSKTKEIYIESVG